MSSSEYSDSDDENHSDADIQANGGSENSGQIRRKGRGYDKPKWSKSGKEKIEFTKDGLRIIPKDAKLSRYLGCLARNYSFLPLSHTDWRSHNDPAMEKMWKTISDTIDWRPEDIPYIPTIRHALLKRLSKRVRNNRAALKEKYYTPHVGTPLRFICGDNRVDSEQWQEMVNYWDNDHKNENKVERNVANRKKLKTSHTSGTKTFVRHQAEFVKQKAFYYNLSDSMHVESVFSRTNVFSMDKICSLKRKRIYTSSSSFVVTSTRPPVSGSCTSSFYQENEELIHEVSQEVADEIRRMEDEIEELELSKQSEQVKNENSHPVQRF